MTLDPVPVPLVPPSLDIDGAGLRRLDPRARDPHPAVIAPSMVAGDQDVARTGRNNHAFDYGPGRSFPDNDRRGNADAEAQVDPDAGFSLGGEGEGGGAERRGEEGKGGLHGFSG